MIQNIVLDIGNVLVSYEPEAYIRSFTQEEARIKLLCQQIFQSAPWHAGDAGEMSRQETTDALCAQYPQDAGLIRQILGPCDEMLKAIPENTLLLKKLKSAGFSLYFLSNTNPSAFAYMTQTHEFFSYLDGGIASFRVRQMKPGREIYQTFLYTYGLSPESCLFVDDTPANVETARSVGMQGLHLPRPEQLEALLREYPQIRQRLDAACI